MAGERPHLRIDGFATSNNYVYPKDIAPDFPVAERNRIVHGNKIITQLNTIKAQFGLAKEEPLPENIVRDDALYVEFTSEWDYSLAFDSFSQETDKPKYQLLSIKKETDEVHGEIRDRYRVLVMMLEGGVSNFLKKAGEYLVRNTEDKSGNNTGLPKHRALIANIETIALATLRAFWADEPEVPFPNEEDLVWWEVWFRRTGDDTSRLDRVAVNLEAVGAQISQQTLVFPEHIVRLVRASATQLSRSIVLLDNLAELRKPQQLNDFITSKHVDFDDKKAWMADLMDRTEANLNEHSVVVCLLDSGVNNQHPLLTRFLPDNRLYTYKESWGTNDSWDQSGHGTGMGGIALYGDLTEAMTHPGSIRILHALESFKIAHPRDPNDPQLYGEITRYACSAPVVDFPGNHRIYCMAITNGRGALRGRPSTWSAAIDQVAFGRGMEVPQLFIVSSGNVDYLLPARPAAEYPHYNQTESVHDPGQSYNALTVGSYTRMDRVDQRQWPGMKALAKAGGMAPSNSTTLLWEDQWPFKPDIVMEGGNLGVKDGAVTDPATLKPLSLDADFRSYIFAPFGDTSGATALAAKLAAELWTAYPAYWPETIKGLLVHGARWTKEMLNGIDLRVATGPQKRELLRTYGFGVPIPQKVFYSAGNALTLIAENELQPYKQEGSTIKTNAYHLYQLPWPADILMNALTTEDVFLRVTLCYFVDPNPGNRRYASSFSYHSHSLDFRMIRPTESLKEFKRRVSGAEAPEGMEYYGEEEPWIFKERMRNRGSIKKDLVISSGADLATRQYIAVYPKSGWYRTRKRQNMANSTIRYSLIIGLETKKVDIDLYTPIEQLVAVKVNV